MIMKICFLNIHIQISYTPNSELLSNRRLFPNVWKTFPPVSSLHSPTIAILRQYNWTKLKVITQDEDLFRQVRWLWTLIKINVTPNCWLFTLDCKLNFNFRALTILLENWQLLTSQWTWMELQFSLLNQMCLSYQNLSFSPKKLEFISSICTLHMQGG
jgi:hypothetical protein